MILFLCAWSGVGAWGQRSAFEAQLKDFTHSLAIQLSSKTPKDSPVAIADFDDKDAAIGDADLGYAVSEIVTQEFQRSGYFLVLEKKQLDRILKTMELQLSGLYDSDKAASIGKLIDAKYLAFIGSSMSWFATTPQGLGTYSIGLALGGSYQIARSQWLSLETIFYFWHYMYSDSLQSGQIGLGGTAGSYMYDEYKLLDAFVILGEYGYRFPLSRAISLQSTLGLGAVVGGSAPIKSTRPGSRTPRATSQMSPPRPRSGPAPLPSSGSTSSSSRRIPCLSMSARGISSMLVSSRAP